MNEHEIKLKTSNTKCQMHLAFVNGHTQKEIIKLNNGARSTWSSCAPFRTRERRWELTLLKALQQHNRKHSKKYLRVLLQPNCSFSNEIMEKSNQT